MTLDDAKRYWWSDRNAETPRTSPDQLLALVKADAARFDKRVRFRDVREMVAAAIGVALIAPTAIHANGLARLGVVVVIAAAVLIAVKLSRAARTPFEAGVDHPVAVALRAERSQLNAQIHLLETVLWWYVGPMWLGLVMIIAGRGGASWLTLGCSAAVTVLSFVVLQLNAITARRYLRPRSDDLSRLLAEFDVSANAAG